MVQQVIQLSFIEGVGGGELLLVMVVALMLFGSRNLPKVARNFGRATEHLRKAAREVQRELLQADMDGDRAPSSVKPLTPAAHLREPPPDAKEKHDEPVAG